MRLFASGWENVNGKFAVGLLLAVRMTSGAAFADETVALPRADGSTTPMRVYASRTQGSAPLAVISPGRGSS